MNESTKTNYYFKIKFEGTLSDYKREIVAKFFFYLHNFVVPCDSFIKEWQSFSLPIPYNCNLNEAYQEMSNCSEFCIQDDRCKYRMNLEDGRNTAVSIMTNLALKALDNGQGLFHKLVEPTCEEMSEYLRKRSDGLIMLNSWLFSFQFLSTDNNNLTLDKTVKFYPNDSYWGLSRSISNIVDTYYNLYSGGYVQYDESVK